MCSDHELIPEIHPPLLHLTHSCLDHPHRQLWPSPSESQLLRDTLGTSVLEHSSEGRGGRCTSEICQVSSDPLLWAEHTVGRAQLLPCSWGQGRGSLCWEDLKGTAGAQRYWGLPPCRDLGLVTTQAVLLAPWAGRYLETLVWMGIPSPHPCSRRDSCP